MKYLPLAGRSIFHAAAWVAGGVAEQGIDHVPYMALELLGQPLLISTRIATGLNTLVPAISHASVEALELLDPSFHIYFCSYFTAHQSTQLMATWKSRHWNCSDCPFPCLLL